MSQSTMLICTTLLALSCTLSGCSEGGSTSKPSTSEVVTSTEASMVFVNAQVYTVNTKQPWAEAVAIQGNKIVYVGSDTQAQSYITERTEVIDLKGKMLMPGFHDVHIHPLESASEVTQFTLPGYASEDEYIDRLYEASLSNPNTDWLIGYGHEIATLLDMQTSPLAVLDEAIPERPVIIMEQTSHSMWVNSKALSLAGITANRKDPVGGVIGRDEQGNLNGILYDNAGNQLMELAMNSRPDAQTQDYFGLIEYTMPELNKVGITSISDARTYWQRGHLQTWQRVADEDKLTLRVSLGLWAYPQMSDEKQIVSLKSMFSRPSDSLLKVDQVKFYMDGILVNSTAAMHEPYEVNWLNLYQNKGLNYFTQARLEKYIQALEPTGFDFNIHGIGDRGIHEALNAIENASNGHARHRVTHLEVVDPADMPRFAKLNVIADAQVAGEFSQPEHWSENIPLIGAQRSENLVPIKSLQRANATLTLSSDWNVSTFNPFVGISHAISRAPQNITLAQAIAAYTINGAYAMRQEHLVGSIEVGKRADLVVLGSNLFDLTAEQIKQVTAELTLLDGEVVYQAY
ncbi:MULTISPECIES: amidohydrolase [Pseudoalteromonas]|uniref:Amidohydrolase n=1 Tax=Pseudoalteromonas amylolytica TaxID=1859457 RepID=A0A1S1MT90_9GAMM|nr:MULTISPECIES: amidohydrolase [Pseudoalteromonas]OHU85101.1 amidohydrolase [Pseudoalteromonas sp. JW3]OHU89948.1 amidohydrolase [Pseudoalteromonas amylolytica]